MIQDIYPSKLINHFVDYKITVDDTLIVFDDAGRILAQAECNAEDAKNHFLTGASVPDLAAASGDGTKPSTIYLFSIDEKKYFLLLDNKAYLTSLQKDNYRYYSIREVRDAFTEIDAFVAFTAYHLWQWYADNRFCGKCGGELVPDHEERALRCPKCGNIIYPRINPAVIVGVKNGDRILLTKYRKGYSHNALVAGFTEIGETLEETVAREVMEEAGIKVKNIQYYKSQPWGMAQDILVGFYCEADGDTEIHMDQSELKYAEWVKKEDIVLQPNNLSLTNEMMRVFKDS